MDCLDVRPQTGHGRYALETGLIVVSADRQRPRPSLRSVVDRSQTAQTRHRRRVLEPEVVGDVTLADVDVKTGRRIAADGDASQRSRLVLDGSENV